MWQCLVADSDVSRLQLPQKPMEPDPMSTVLVPAAITVDPSLQPRVGGLDAEHVRVIQEVPESWPPLGVVYVNGNPVLVDGFHRFAAAQNLELPTVPVQVM